MAETYDFGEFQLQGQSGKDSRPSGDYHSIDDVINVPIWVTGFEQDVETDNGLRTLVRFKYNFNEAETAFFTSSKKLQKALLNLQMRFPFSTIIKVVIIRDMTGFEFRSAKEAVSNEDIDNFNLYVIKKRSYLKQMRYGGIK